MRSINDVETDALEYVLSASYRDAWQMQDYPGIRDGELLWGIVHAPITTVDWDHIPFKTKRIVGRAFDSEHRLIEKKCAIFVQEHELELELLRRRVHALEEA